MDKFTPLYLAHDFPLQEYNQAPPAPLIIKADNLAETFVHGFSNHSVFAHIGSNAGEMQQNEELIGRAIVTGAHMLMRDHYLYNPYDSCIRVNLFSVAKDKDIAKKELVISAKVTAHFTAHGNENFHFRMEIRIDEHQRRIKEFKYIDKDKVEPVFSIPIPVWHDALTPNNPHAPLMTYAAPTVKDLNGRSIQLRTVGNPDVQEENFKEFEKLGKGTGQGYQKWLYLLCNIGLLQGMEHVIRYLQGISLKHTFTPTEVITEIAMDVVLLSGTEATYVRQFAAEKHELLKMKHVDMSKEGWVLRHVDFVPTAMELAKTLTKVTMGESMDVPWFNKKGICLDDMTHMHKADKMGKLQPIGHNFSIQQAAAEFSMPSYNFNDAEKAILASVSQKLGLGKVTIEPQQWGDVSIAFEHAGQAAADAVQKFQEAMTALAENKAILQGSGAEPVGESVMQGALKSIGIDLDTAKDLHAQYHEAFDIGSLGGQQVPQPKSQQHIKAGVSLSEAVANAKKGMAEQAASKTGKLQHNPSASALGTFFKGKVKKYFNKQVTLNPKAFGQLKQLITRVGKNRIYRTMETVLDNWEEFLAYVKEERNWEPDCKVPNMGILLYLGDEMVEFYAMKSGDKDVAEDGKQAYKTKDEVAQSNKSAIDNIWS